MVLIHLLIQLIRPILVYFRNDSLDSIDEVSLIHDPILTQVEQLHQTQVLLHFFPPHQSTHEYLLELLKNCLPAQKGVDLFGDDVEILLFLSLHSVLIELVVIQMEEVHSL